MKALKNQKLIVGVAIVVLLLLFRPIRDSVREYSVVTIYPIGKMNDGSWTLPLNRSRYRIYEDKNEVMYWLPGVIDAPRRLDNCVIRDRCNWSCPYSDGLGDMSIEGCRGINNELGTLPVRYTSGMHWWKLHFD